MKKIIALTFITIALCSNLNSQNSVLSAGDWHKISTSTEGVYKISYTDLQSYGINPSTIDPRNIKLFGNGGGMLNQLNSAPKIDDLQELAIKVIGENDGVFNTSDYILFYGQSPDTWNYDYTSQTYTHEKTFIAIRFFIF